MYREHEGFFPISLLLKGFITSDKYCGCPQGNAIMNLFETCQEAYWKIVLMDYPMCTKVDLFPFM